MPSDVSRRAWQERMFAGFGALLGVMALGFHWL
jgi:hypothetical protein